MKKNSLKIQDFKKKMSKAQLIDALIKKNTKGGQSDPPPFGQLDNCV
ncbi:MAG: hypothetical protein AB8H03_00665 [Saprospiraceae bacterium]